MEKLLLKHIVGYLPYGLKCLNQHLPDRELIIEELLGISNHITWCGIFNAKNGSNHVPVCGLKPLLHPLSDLTKEIEVNGEKFVPIVELFKMRTQYLPDSIDKYYIENDTAILKLQENTYPDGTISYCHFFEIDIDPEAINFSLATEYYKTDVDEIWKEEFGFIGNEFNMLQKLYEWHFDIYGLIEKGLAIDINTLDNGIQ